MGFAGKRRCQAALLAGLCWLLSQPAWGLDLQKQYEDELVRWALDQSGLEPELHPEGKLVERVVIVREEIIAPSDPWPGVLNYAHVKTKEHIVRREVLVRPGQVWDPALVEESARNLRKLFILAVVRVLPCKSSSPDGVVLLVVTKDLWSIRFNQSFFQVGTVLDHYESWPTEQNFFGLNRRLSLNLRLQQADWATGRIHDNLTLGQLYVDPRIWGSRVMLVEAFRATFAGDVPCGGALGAGSEPWCAGVEPGAPEGLYAQVLLRRPLFALAATWAFEVFGAVNIEQVRTFRFNPEGEEAPLGESVGLSLRTDPFSDTVAIPRAYQARELSAAAELTHSSGRDTKHDLSAGLAAFSYRYRHPSSMLLDDSARRWHTLQFLPRSEDASYLYLSYRTHSPRFARVHNIQTFALSEDFTLGQDLRLEARLGSSLEREPQPFAVLLFRVKYRWYFLDDLLTLGLSGRSRLQPGLRQRESFDPDLAGDFYDSQFIAEASNASPELWVGRLHLRTRLILRRNVVDTVYWEPLPASAVVSRRVFLGSSSGLRGYGSGQFEGDNLWQLNAEFRSLPINFYTLHFGLLLFYDGGVAFGGPDPYAPERALVPSYQHSVGVGLRGLFPQFDKETLRIDFAVPLTADAGAVGTWFSLSFGQIF